MTKWVMQMICEEKGVFLEIADIVRSLGLTILKGIMESHGDKVWAKFVVEASAVVSIASFYPMDITYIQWWGTGI